MNSYDILGPLLIFARLTSQAHPVNDCQGTYDCHTI